MVTSREEVAVGAPRHARNRPPTWSWWLIVGGMLALLYPLTIDILPFDAGYLGVGGASVVAVIIGIRRHRPTPSTAWTVLAGGLALTVLGDLVYVAWTGATGEEPPFPGIPDLLYLPGMAGIVSSGLILAAQRHRTATIRSLIDAALIAVSVAVLLWLAIGADTLRGEDATVAVVVTGLAYPLMGMVLVGVLSALLLGGQRTSVAIRLLIGAFAVQLVTDTVYLTVAVEGLYADGGWLDSGWLVTYVLIGAAALHPTMRAGAIPAPARLVELSRRHVVGLSVPILLAAVLLLSVAHTQARDDPGRFLIDLTVLVAAGAIVAILLMVRVGSVSNELARTARERDRGLHRELVVADVASRLARASTVAEAHEALSHAGALLPEGGRVELLDDPPQPPAERWVSPPIEGGGVLVATTDGPLERDVSRALERLTSDVAMALDRCRLAVEGRRLQAQLQHQATHDPLTGVANRRRFGDEVGRRGVSGIDAVVFLDLDRFKEINDRLGHGAGDQALRTIARRLAADVRPDDLVARLGGDEFAVLLRGTTVEQASATAERLLELVQRPIRIGTELVSVAASAGLSISDPDEDLAEDLLHDADLAMYMAKSTGRGRVERATPEVRRRTDERLSFEADLRATLDAGGLTLEYRPVVDLVSRRLVGLQAELRWVHPVRGDVPSAEFLLVAGRIGVLDRLATWAFDQACASARIWLDLDPDLRICIPFPGVALRTPLVADALEASLRAAGLRGADVVLQTAGSTLLEDPRPTGSLERLRASGVRIRVTDFGTNTPMRVVRDAPVDELLLSAQLVAGLTAGPEEAALGRAVLLLAESFSLAVVAEGITSTAQIEALVTRGARCGTGPLLGAAMVADEVTTTLADRRPTLAAPPDQLGR